MFSGDMLPWGMFGLGVAMLIAILFRRSGRYYHKLKRTRNRSPRPPRAKERAEPLADAPVETLRWQVEMHETARELKGELDSKMIALQVLTNAAQQQIERLEQVIAVARQTGVKDPLCELEQLADGKPLHELDLPPVSQTAPDPELKRQVHELAAAGHASQAIAQRLGATLGDVELMLSLRTGS